MTPVRAYALAMIGFTIAAYCIFYWPTFFLGGVPS